MADGDRQLAFTTGPVPSSVQVSGPDRLTPKSVNASFDGTSAAGPFLPCLIITGRTGLEVARIPAPQVAAGASAEVSWFPRVGGASSSGGGGVTDREQIQSNAPTLIAGSDYLDWDHLSGNSLLDFTNPKAPTVKTAGVYAVTTSVGVDPMSAGANYYSALQAGSPDFPEVISTAATATAAQPQPYATCSLTYFLRKNVPLFAYVFNFDPVPRNFVIFRAEVQRIS